MKTFLCGATFAVVLATSASAASITYKPFSYDEYKSLTANAAASEDFENPRNLSYSFEGDSAGKGTAPDTYGEIAGQIGTAVGEFRTHGNGVGSGTTCVKHDLGNNGCSSIALQNEEINGQGSVLPEGGRWALNSNDTLGMLWDVALPGNAMFTSLVFSIRDAADQGATFSVSVNGGQATSFSNAANNNRQLWQIDFDNPMSSAQVLLANSKTNDAFTIDGAAVMMSPVPVPAAALLLLSALGVTAGSRAAARRPERHRSSRSAGPAPAGRYPAPRALSRRAHTTYRGCMSSAPDSSTCASTPNIPCSKGPCG